MKDDKEAHARKWLNDKPLNLRTRLALKVLMLVYRTLAPYEYEHSFKKEIDDITKAIDSYVEPK